MTVYVDDMYKTSMGKYRRMKMSHMISDSEDELHEMAKRIGVARKWYQGDHYDVCLAMRTKAVELGAVEVPMLTLSAMALNRRAGLPMGTPETARGIRDEHRRKRNEV